MLFADLQACSMCLLSAQCALLASVPYLCATRPSARTTPCTLTWLLFPQAFGHAVPGPAIIINDLSTIIVEPSCTAHITQAGDVRIEIGEVLVNSETMKRRPRSPLPPAALIVGRCRSVRLGMRESTDHAASLCVTLIAVAGILSGIQSLHSSVTF